MSDNVSKKLDKCTVYKYINVSTLFLGILYKTVKKLENIEYTIIYSRNIHTLIVMYRNTDYILNFFRLKMNVECGVA